MNTPERHPVAVIGGGFSGLAAAYELSLRGIPCTVYEADASVGGLAGSFQVEGTDLEKFYHHWFTSDEHVMGLVEELGLADRLVEHASRTGLYYANRHYRLASPLDVLRFDPLSWPDRIRLGLGTLRARRVDEWKPLEQVTSAEWLRQMFGPRVYEVVWEPLLRGKFGEYADSVAAVWMWNKLKLRGGSRKASGAESLMYLRGGFAALAERTAERIEELGGRVETDSPVTGIETRDGSVSAVIVDGKAQPVSAVLGTTALPLIADIVREQVDDGVTAALERIDYLGAVCIVLELDRSLSETYWLNVNDLSFPFVGVIEHTNMEPASAYGGRHIVYLSRYLTETDPLFTMSDDDAVGFGLEHLGRMFPELERDWVLDGHVWRARYAQPIVERDYTALLEAIDLPFDNFHLASMAQIYPEDRGTNYAVRDGRTAARHLAQAMGDRSA